MKDKSRCYHRQRIKKMSPELGPHMKSEMISKNISSKKAMIIITTYLVQPAFNLMFLKVSIPLTIKNINTTINGYNKANRQILAKSLKVAPNDKTHAKKTRKVCAISEEVTISNICLKKNLTSIIYQSIITRFQITPDS